MTSNMIGPVLWEVDARGVATGTLNRPEVTKAYDGALLDAVLAAEHALLSIAEVRWGLHASIIIPQLADAIGVRQLRRYALTGERFGAEEACRIGLVHKVVPLATLEAEGGKMVEHVLANG